VSSRAPDTDNAKLPEAAPATAPAPRFPHPKILAIDVPETAHALAEAGYAVAKGTYGTPLRVPREVGYRVPKYRFELPNHAEREVVIVDVAGPDARPATNADFENLGRGISALWAPTDSGVVDPRLPAMHAFKEDFDRIHAHGGILIVFADLRIKVNFAQGKEYDVFNGYGDTHRLSNWGVIQTLDWLTVGMDGGEEIELADNGYAEQLGLGSYLRNATFTCVLSPDDFLSDRWATFATNKYGQPVSGMIGPDTEGQGWVFVFPRVRQRSELVRELLDHVLPRLAPALFPHVERDLWTHRPAYELPEVTAVKTEIETVEQAARVRVRELEEQIERERERSGFLHELLTETGDKLVQAVITALEEIGFQDVRDADAEREAAEDTDYKREDVHIMDTPMPVLVEVKGIGGLPKEANSLQVAKYLTPRMREWNRTDLRGLAVVNHQRSLPALDREHEHVFQPDVLINAETQEFGLLTTWDLHRLVRSFRALGWQHDDIVHLFTTSGRVHPVPAHYEHIGHVDGFWEQANALGLRIEAGKVAVGDRLAYELPVEYVEETVASLQLDDQAVTSASVSQHVGVRTSLTKQQARKGVRVYRIRNDAPSG
jgi:hypothetical protein